MKTQNTLSVLNNSSIIIAALFFVFNISFYKISHSQCDVGISIAAQTNINCYGYSNGSVTAGTATGGTAPYIYWWSGVQVPIPETVVWNFESGSDGQYPQADLVYNANNGLFYATTNNGGSNGMGAIISFSPSTNAEAVVWNFGSGFDGAFPYGNLVYYASNGLFYGMTYSGGSNDAGAIISFNPSNNSESLLWSFGSGNDGQYPYGDLIYDANTGLFYGMTNQGGSYGLGVILSFNPTTNTESVLWNFGNGNDGQYPQESFVYDSNNDLLYGTTFSGGSNGGGTIISFDPSNNTESIVWNFGSVIYDGQLPFGTLVYDANNGNYYGMTYSGGTNGAGAIISFNPTTNTESVGWNFGSGSDGQNPYGNLVYGINQGLLYGMTYFGGSNGEGSIISFNPTTDAETVVWNFGNGNDGKYPQGELVYNIVNGLFYGTTTSGGSYGMGTILSFNPMNSLTLNNLIPGTYTITATDNNGCSATSSVSITQPSSLSVTASIIQNVSCFGFSNGSIQVNPEGGTLPYTYLWNNGAITSSITGLTAGTGGTTYSAMVTDNCNSSASASVIIVEPALLSISIASQTNVSCYGYSNGSATPNTATGGTPPYTYSWSGGKPLNPESVIWNFGSGSDGQQPGASFVYDANNGLFYGTSPYGGSHG